MADDVTTEIPEPTPVRPTKRPRSNLLPALVVAGGLVGGGFLMQEKSHSDASAAPAPASVPTDATDCEAWDIRNEPEDGAVAKLEPISVNLESDDDGTPHYAKVGIALQLAGTVDHGEFTSDELAYRSLDVVNAVLVGRSVSEFGSPQALEAVKDKITEEVRPLYGCEVLDVLITDFVMQ